MSYFMCIDAGTGSGRAIIFDVNGNQISISQQEWSHKAEMGVPNSMSFDTSKNWDILRKCIKESIFKAGISSDQIKAVTTTSMREGIVLYDKEQKELFAVANVDSRASNEVKYLKEKFPQYENEFYKISGQTFALGAIPRLLWVKNNKANIYEKTQTISMISDWIGFKLSGVIASEPSNAGTSGVFSLEKRDWDASMAKKCGVKDDIFPKVYESGEIYANVSQKGSDECGLSTSCQVVMGGGDVQLGAVGLGVVKENQVAILGGTFWQQLVNTSTSKVHPNMDIRVNPHVIKGLNQAEAISFFSGYVMRWFRDNFCSLEMLEAKKSNQDTYTLLEKLASKVPAASHGILPIFSDTMKYSKWYHASPSFLNLNLETSSKGAMFRSLEENAAIVAKLNLDNIFDFTGVDVDTITFAGGASKGALWSQILADVTNKEIKIPKVNEATALGGAFVCMKAVGEYSSIEEVASTLVKWDKTYTPNIKNKEIYDNLTSKWIKAYSSSLNLVDQKITTSMWSAPGL